MKKVLLMLVASLLLISTQIRAETRYITLCWDKEPEADEFAFVQAYTHAELEAKIANNQEEKTTVNNCICVAWDDSYPGVHMAVAAKKGSLYSGWSEAFHLFANVDDNFNDKNSAWNEVSVGPYDYIAFVYQYNNHAYAYDVPRYGLSCGDPALADVPLPTQLQWCDLNHDGNITYDDYFIFVWRYNFFPTLF